MRTANRASAHIGQAERWLSAVGGAALAAYGLNRRSVPGALVAAAGASLIYRGLTAHWPVYERAGISAAAGAARSDTVRALRGRRGVIVEESIRINAPLEELYEFWRNLENLPRFMTHLRSVRVLDPIASHWVARAPAGRTVEWDAEIINEVPNQVMGWRSVQGAEVVNAGSVNFDAAGERGTRVTVKLQYSPPGGKIGAALAWMFGEEPSQQIREDLRRLKQLIEAGEVPTTEGQPRGGSAPRTRFALYRGRKG